MAETIFYLAPGCLGKNLSYNLVTDAGGCNTSLVNYILEHFIVDEKITEDLLIISNAWWLFNSYNYDRVHVLLYPDQYVWGFSNLLAYDCLTKLPVLNGKLSSTGIKYVEENKDILSFLQFGANKHEVEIMQCVSILSDKSSRDLYKNLVYSDIDTIANHYINNVYNKVQYFEYLDYFPGMLIINAGVDEGYEIAYFEALTARSCQVLNIDPSGHDNLSRSAQCIVGSASGDRYQEVRHVLWDDCGIISVPISNNGSVLSQYYGNNLHELEELEFSAVSLDYLVDFYKLERIDLIKMDIEGGEQRALQGALASIKRFRPQLAISIYHWPVDYWEIPIFLSQNLENYSFYFGHYSPGRWEAILYAKPNETNRFTGSREI